MENDEKRIIRPVTLTEEQMKRYSRKKFMWGDNDVVAYKNKADMKNQSKKVKNPALDL